LKVQAVQEFSLEQCRRQHGLQELGTACSTQPAIAVCRQNSKQKVREIAAGVLSHRSLPLCSGFTAEVANQQQHKLQKETIGFATTIPASLCGCSAELSAAITIATTTCRTCMVCSLLLANTPAGVANGELVAQEQRTAAL
jgi:hypothetical protein